MHDVYGQTIPRYILASLHAQSWSVVGAVVLPSLGSLFHASLLYSYLLATRTCSYICFPRRPLPVVVRNCSKQAVGYRANRAGGACTKDRCHKEKNRI